MVFIFLQNWRKWSIIVHSESRVATGWWYWQSYLMTCDNSCLMTLICGDDIGQLLLPLADEIDNHAWWCLITLDLRWWHWSVVMTVIMPYSDDDGQNLPHQSTKVFYTCVVHTLPRRHLICNEFPINLFLQKHLANLTLKVLFLIKGCSIRWVCKTVASTEYYYVSILWYCSFDERTRKNKTLDTHQVSGDRGSSYLMFVKSRG